LKPSGLGDSAVWKNAQALNLLPKLIFSMLKLALTIEHIFSGNNRQYGKVESKGHFGRKYQGFCDIFHGFPAIAILLILFCM